MNVLLRTVQRVFFRWKLIKALSWFVVCIVLLGGVEPVSAKMGVFQALRLGDAMLQVEVVRSESERYQGLKHRTVLEEGKGMLFVFERLDSYSFWMSETLIPLDIAFFDEQQVLTEILQLFPHDLTPKAPRKPFKYALEVPQGWFKHKGINSGIRFVLEE